MHLRFAYPVFFYFLPLALIWFFKAFKGGNDNLVYSMTGLCVRISGKQKTFLQKFPKILRFISLILILMAASRPQTYTISKNIEASGVSIILCLDTSGSMRAMDFKINGHMVTRLTVVKNVVKEFVNKRLNDRIGIIVFGEKAFTLCPLTLDKKLVLDLINEIKIGLAGDRTAIGTALILAARRLKNVKSKSRIVILLTDGRNNAGEIDPGNASLLLKKLGIKIYSIGIGSKGLAPFLVNTSWGQKYVYKTVYLDEKTLEYVASTTGGRYFQASDSAQLIKVYEAINKEEKSKFEIRTTLSYRDVYPFLVCAATLVLVLEIVLSFTVGRTIP